MKILKRLSSSLGSTVSLENVRPRLVVISISARSLTSGFAVKPERAVEARAQIEFREHGILRIVARLAIGRLVLVHHHAKAEVTQRAPGGKCLLDIRRRALEAKLVVANFDPVVGLELRCGR